VFFNFFDAAEPHTSMKITHGTPCALIHESSRVQAYGRSGSFRVSGDRGRESVGVWKQSPKKLTIIKAAGKIGVTFNDCMRDDIFLQNYFVSPADSSKILYLTKNTLRGRPPKLGLPPDLLRFKAHRQLRGSGSPS